MFMDDPSLLDRGTISASSHAHTAIAEAVLAGNEGLARHRMRKHLVAEADYLQVRAHTRIGLPRTTSDEKRGSPSPRPCCATTPTRAGPGPRRTDSIGGRRSGTGCAAPCRRGAGGGGKVWVRTVRSTG